MAGINVITDALERTLKQFPEARRAAVERATAAIENRVRDEIGARINDSQGRIASYQRIRIGSGGGYGVVEANKGTATGSLAKGALTNYLERGHRIRSPKSSGSKGYKPRIKMAHVPGRWFYAAAEAEAERIALDQAKKVCAELAHMLEGG